MTHLAKKTDTAGRFTFHSQGELKRSFSHSRQPQRAKTQTAQPVYFCSQFGTTTMTCASSMPCMMNTLWSTPLRRRKGCLRSSISFTVSRIWTKKSKFLQKLVSKWNRKIKIKLLWTYPGRVIAQFISQSVLVTKDLSVFLEWIPPESLDNHPEIPRPHQPVLCFSPHSRGQWWSEAEVHTVFPGHWDHRRQHCLLP